MVRILLQLYNTYAHHINDCLGFPLCSKQLNIGSSSNSNPSPDPFPRLEELQAIATARNISVRIRFLEINVVGIAVKAAIRVVVYALLSRPWRSPLAAKRDPRTGNSDEDGQFFYIV